MPPTGLLRPGGAADGLRDGGTGRAQEGEQAEMIWAAAAILVAVVTLALMRGTSLADDAMEWIMEDDVMERIMKDGMILMGLNMPMMSGVDKPVYEWFDPDTLIKRSGKMKLNNNLDKAIEIAKRLNESARPFEPGDVIKAKRSLDLFGNSDGELYVVAETFAPVREIRSGCLDNVPGAAYDMICVTGVGEKGDLTLRPLPSAYFELYNPIEDDDK